MFQDSELEGPDDRVVCLDLQKQVGERPVLDLENKLVKTAGASMVSCASCRG